ncbi:MAG TPA: nuclear transport factor 2 family protein, partial [Solirubrobacteraceae bacterium]|nr:nuclear transport factor 2 family protein [Solirubrobacteraceae bacterium]
MSQANVDLVTQLQPAPDVDIAELFRNDDMWSAAADAIAPLFHPDFESVPPGVPATERVHVGLDGLRAAWREWLEPWLTYRTEVKQALDAGDRVLLLNTGLWTPRGDRAGGQARWLCCLEDQGREDRSRRVLPRTLRSIQGCRAGGVG